ncbi:MAG: hypothetical protein RR376_19715, partial [Janthinobacterium sp.]
MAFFFSIDFYPYNYSFCGLTLPLAVSPETSTRVDQVLLNIISALATARRIGGGQRTDIQE